MNIHMTSQTVREHFQLLLIMGLTVALGTRGNLAVLIVTTHTRDLTVFARRLLPLPINFVVTRAAGLQHRAVRQTNL